MPQDPAVCKRKDGIDQHAKDAKAKLEKIKAANQDLAYDLDLVKADIDSILRDPHKPK
jgi:hypothetical protein